MEEPGDPEAIQARLTVFGHEATPAGILVVHRNTRWRAARAARPLILAALVAPLVTLVPPHAPWLIGSLVLGFVTARRRWSERVTLLGGSGPCPRCGETLDLPGPIRLRSPHPVTCPSCRHEAALNAVLETP